MTHQQAVADIEALARECATFALEQGATAPWGDGDTCLGGDWDALVELLGREPGADELRTWDRAFRATVGVCIIERKKTEEVL